MQTSYSILTKILDDFCAQAPKAAAIYRPDSASPHYRQKQTEARSRALLHLYLTVECGLKDTDFSARESLICDGPQDGGLDAYFIDPHNKRILLIQSKYRASHTGFEQTSITADELLRMELDRITKGESCDSKGIAFNSHVRRFQSRIQKTPGVAKYSFRVVILANQKTYTPDQIKRVVGDHEYEIFDSASIYHRLVFPVCQGTYYNPKEIEIKVPLSQKQAPRLKQIIQTSGGACDITVMYVPAIEIGKLLLEYKNSILKFNPRNFLSLSQSGTSVNSRIASSIRKKKANDFAILNNGITILADDSSVTDHSGRKNTSILTIVNPQIINGGQTAFTLSQIYSDSPSPAKVFKGKEVLLKIVTIELDEDSHDEFVASISDATNQQNPVKEADRRSNNPVFQDIQDRIFLDFGLFFERKRGEFYNGKLKGYVSPSLIVNRVDFLRSWSAFKGDVTSARRGEYALFEPRSITKLLPSASAYRDALLAYLIFLDLKSKRKSYKRGQLGISGCDNAFTYGKYAMIAATAHYIEPIRKQLTLDAMNGLASTLAHRVLSQWEKFERFAVKASRNSSYFAKDSENFDYYYKGKTINDDISSFFKPRGNRSKVRL